MQPKEVEKILGITRDRIKFFMKRAVFKPENQFPERGSG